MAQKYPFAQPASPPSPAAAPQPSASAPAPAGEGKQSCNVSTRIKVTQQGIVCNGKTFDFETCEGTGDGLESQVRCKGIGRERVVCVCVLHFRGEGGGDEGVYCDV